MEISVLSFLNGLIGFDYDILVSSHLFAVNSVFIEKILRTEPDVGKMYLLIKAKNNQAAMERLQNEVWLLYTKF